jgi:hypothetical protein
LPGEIEFLATCETHAARAVEEEIDMQVLFLLKPLKEQFAVASVDVPVEIAEVIPGGILPMLGELNPAAELHRPPLGKQ